jgi:hypothetical protein
MVGQSDRDHGLQNETRFQFWLRVCVLRPSNMSGPTKLRLRASSPDRGGKTPLAEMRGAAPPQADRG